METMEPAHVLVTGAAGRIGYNICYWVASGMLYGDRPIILHAFGTKEHPDKLKGLEMELQDCAFKTLAGIVASTEPEVAFKDVDCAFLVASVRVKSHTVRRDLIEVNYPVYKAAGEYLSMYAKPTCKVIAIGNPTNTNAVVTAMNCKNIPKENIFSLSMLDHIRTVGAIAHKLGVNVNAIKGVMIWGNHDDSMAVDLSHATYIKDGKEISIEETLGNDYLRGEFSHLIERRGWSVVSFKGCSSTAPTANAAIKHMKAVLFGTAPGEIVSLGVYVPEHSPYGIPPGIMCSMPCTVDKDGTVHIVEGLKIDDWLAKRIANTTSDLIKEKELAFGPKTDA